MIKKRKLFTIKIIYTSIFLFFFFLSSSVAFISSTDNKGNDPWTSFLHDTGNSGYSTSRIGLDPFSTQKIGYVGTKKFYGAVIQNDVIYVSATNYEEEYSEVIAFTLKDLKQIWRTVFEKKFAFAPPVLNQDHNRIYIPCTDGFSIRGKSSSLIYSLELENGDFEWIREVDGAVFGPLLYHNGLLFYQNFYCPDIKPGTTSEPGDIGCINASNGTVKWVKRMAYSFFQGAINNLFPAILGDQILVPNTYIRFKEDQGIEIGQTSVFYSFNQQTGNKTKEINKKDCVLPSLSVDNNSYYLTYSEVNDNVPTQKLEAYTIDGAQKWSLSLPDSIGYCSAPIFNSSYIFLRNRFGKVYCVNKETGKKLWTATSDFILPSGDGSAYAVNDHFIVSSFLKDNYSHIMIMDLSSPKYKLVWEEKIPDMIFQVILYDEKIIFVGSNNIYIYTGEMPEIFINPNQIDATVNEKEKTSVTIQVSNKGKGKLIGSFHSDESWIQIPQTSFENNRTVNIVLDASELNEGTYTSNILIISNAGNYSIPVLLKVLKKDLSPPDITISYPEDYFETIESDILIKGKVSDEESGILSLSINNDQVLFDEVGYFEHNTPLSIGENSIEITAINNVEISSLKAITVIRKLPDITGPVITISSPSPDYLTNIPRVDIKGRIIDPESNITSITLNQKPVWISENGIFESKDNLLKEGINLFTIEAINSFNLSSSASIQVTLDTIPPNIIFLYPDTDMVTNEEDVLISCLIEEKGSEIDSVYINDQLASVNQDNITELVIRLNEGENLIEVRATDTLGNSNVVTRSIYLDTQDPTIEFISKWDPKEILYISIYELRFRVQDRGAGVESVAITDKYDNKIALEQNHNGYKASLILRKGVNTFRIITTDKASNKTEKVVVFQYQPAVVITLVIGQSIAIVQKNLDRKEIPLQAPLVIRKGTTFVPIRFIAETFGARVEWIPYPTNEIQIYFKEILIHLWIHKTIGVVERGTETKKVTLLAAPFITNSTTMVPLRFISENLDAQVVWDAPTSTITIIQAVE